MDTLYFIYINEERTRILNNIKTSLTQKCQIVVLIANKLNTQNYIYIKLYIYITKYLRLIITKLN